MNTEMKQLASVAAAAAISIAAVTLAARADVLPSSIVMTPGKALELQIGDKHSVSYFVPSDAACGLTVVIADSKQSAAENDAHGTRFVISVAPGKTVRVDGTEKKSVEFLCGPGGRKMNARLYDREPYKAAKF